MTTITPEELTKRFSEVKGSKILTVVMNTEVKLLKKSRDTKEPCPYQGVRKRTRAKIIVGSEYEKGVNTRLQKEGKEADFEAQEHAWEVKTDKPIIGTNKAGDQLYLNARIQDSYETEYIVDGNVIDKEELAPYMSKPKPPQNQGTDKPILWRTLKLFPSCSIESYKSDGVEVQVKEPSCEN